MRDLWRLLKLLSPYKLWIIGGIVLSLASTLANISLMACSGWFIAAMGLAGVTGASINYFTPAAIIRACAIIRTAGRYGERLVTHETTFHIIAQLRRWFYDHLEPLAPAVLSKERSGDVLGRLRGDIDVLERFYLNFIVPAAVGVLASVIITLAVYSYHPVLAGIVGAMLFITGGILPLLAFHMGKGSEQKIVDLGGEMRGSMAAQLQGMGELLIYDGAGEFSSRDDGQYSQLQKSQGQVNALDMALQNAAVFCVNIAMIAVMIVAALLSQDDQISLPDVAMLTLLTLASYEAVQPLVSSARSLGGVMRAARRIFDITDQKAPITEPEGAGYVVPKGGAFSLGFDKVSFGYENSSPVFKDLSFDIKSAQKVMVVGPSGAGKSSLINLMLRFWEPQSGAITLCGQSLDVYKGEDVRALFSVVTQDPHLFEATLRRNLLIARPDASDEALGAVCEKAGLADVIAALPDGYDTYIGEHGRQLSGGQMKRLALARALLKKAPCLILDEPGEGLDYEMERDILARVIEALDGAALIYITHRGGVSDRFDNVIIL